MFAVGHAAKNVKVENAKIENSITPAFPPYNIILPPNYLYPPTMFPHNPMHCSPATGSCSQNIPMLSDFLSALDEEQGEENVFKSLETSFQEEGIKVSHIKDLTDSQFERLGVTKVGWQISLKQASAKYI